ncbi:hypothetical protein PTNB85_02215 [Pyrenophora teres f. teres]|nr:hypothetical protein HRS9139_00799 [Pyrenophora teres f. teres]KAE8848372.1 hypothetical protein PTNB85_02215 [Pyrenophora teres f. teres]KAE8868297.1 hypothetical protein PTNB29_02208 [Pyrenophora teres f. teres]
MKPKRKSESTVTADRPEKMAKSVKKSTKPDEEVYTTQQKAAIQQFINFTQLDRNSAIRALKSHGWDAQNAVNSSRSVSSSSRAPPLRNRQSTLDSTIPSPSAVEEHAACDESGTILGPHALEGQNQHLAEEGPPVSALQLASGQGGSQVEQHRRQAEHLSQVLYNGFALEPSVSPPQSQFSLSHQTRHSTMGSQLDTALRLRNITASDPSSHLIDPSLLKLLDSFNATTGISRLASMPDHDPTSLTTVSLRGGEGDIPLPAPYPFNNRSDYGDYVAWKRHYYRLMFRLDLDVSGAYHRTFSQQRQHFITPDFCAELQFLSQIPNSPNILVTSGYEYYGNVTGPNPVASSSATKSTLNTLFNNYVEAGAQDKDIVGVEGTMQYFVEVDVDAEGLDALVALEIVQAPTIGEMSREGFVNGWSERGCDTVDKQKRYIKTLKREMPGSKDLFTRVYRYTFPIAKTAGQKAVALDVALVYWELLFSSPLSAVKWSSPNTPWLTWWTEFLTTSYKKSVNKDMWNETLKFAQLTLEDEAMSFWTEESSWPSVIDDFVDWVKKEKRGDVPEEVMDEEY